MHCIQIAHCANYTSRTARNWTHRWTESGNGKMASRRVMQQEADATCPNDSEDSAFVESESFVKVHNTMSLVL